MASIYKRRGKRGGSWYLSYYVDGRRIRKRIGRSKELAELARKDIEVRIAKEDLGWEEIQDPSFCEFAGRYLKYVRANARPSTCLRYKKAIQHFLDFLNNHGTLSPKLSHISFPLVEEYKQKRAASVQPLTVNVELKVLKALYSFAVRCRCARTNPVMKVSFYREPERKPRFLTKNEIQHLLKNADGLYPIVYTFLKTGLRKSELVNLRWENVDFERQRIRIESDESWRTKTGNSREIPLDDTLVRILKELPRRSEYVFTNTKGRKYAHHLTERVKRLAKRIGLDCLTLHILRHTFISHLVMSGVQLVAVKELAGHSDIKTTMRYVHLTPDHLRDSVARLPY